jgi:hypothetical protein
MLPVSLGTNMTMCVRKHASKPPFTRVRYLVGVVAHNTRWNLDVHRAEGSEYNALKEGALIISCKTIKQEPEG